MGFVTADLDIWQEIILHAIAAGLHVTTHNSRLNMANNICQEVQDLKVAFKSCPTETRPEVIKLFSCSTQLSTKFQLLIKTIIPTNEEVSCFKSLRYCIYRAYKY